MSSRSSRTPRRRRRGGVRRSRCRVAAAKRRVLTAHGKVDVEPVRPGDDVVVLMLMQPDVDALGLVYILCVH
jgi:hypothetical protein